MNYFAIFIIKYLFAKLIMLYIPQATVTKTIVDKFIVREYTCIRAFCKIFQILDAWKNRHKHQ